MELELELELEVVVVVVDPPVVVDEEDELPVDPPVVELLVVSDPELLPPLVLPDEVPPDVDPDELPPLVLPVLLPPVVVLELLPVVLPSPSETGPSPSSESFVPEPDVPLVPPVVSGMTSSAGRSWPSMTSAIGPGILSIT